jgi:DNA-binding LacI/PurR family transcriptional regulator
MAGITIRHVARAAGLSVKTVSRVINDEAGVNKDTRTGVQSVIAEPGCRVLMLLGKWKGGRADSEVRAVIEGESVGRVTTHYRERYV